MGYLGAIAEAQMGKNSTLQAQKDFDVNHTVWWDIRVIRQQW